MENHILFTETQRIKQWWLWLILIFINGMNVWVLIKKYIYKEPFTNTPYHSYTGAEIATLITLLVTVLFLIMKLETVIKTDEIEVRFFPFHLSFRQYPSNTIESAFVRTYKPLAEYGGWGIRIGFAGKAFNVSGSYGIQLIFKDGRKLLVGTQKQTEASAAISQSLLKKE